MSGEKANERIRDDDREWLFHSNYILKHWLMLRRLPSLLDGHFYQMLRLRQRLKLFGQSLHNVDVIKLFDGRNQILYPQN